MRNPIKWIRTKINLLLLNTDDYLYEHIDQAIIIARRLKRLVDAPVTNIIVTITPTSIDNAVAVRLNKIMDEVIIVLSLAEKCKGKENYQQRLRCVVEELRGYSPALQKAIYFKVASLFLRGLRGKEEMREVLADTLIQSRYYEIESH